MKRNKLFPLLFTLTVAGMVSCSDNSTTTGSNPDSTNNAATAGTENTATAANSSNDYSAFADSLERNSQSGYYLNAKTGKPMRLKVNRTNGEIIDEQTNQPVWRYVDNRNWWVYGIDDNWQWENLGEAKMEKDQLMYKADDGKWVNYDQEWMESDQKMTKDYKTRIGDTKIKIGKDGDVKIKDENGKVKYDADKGVIKTDSNKKN